MNKIKLAFISIVVLGFVLRFFLLGTNPPSLDWDEASIGYNAYSILKTAKDEYGNFMPLSFRSFDDFKPPVYIYLTVPSVALFGLSEFAVRFPAAVIGVLAIIVIYFLSRQIFKGRKEGEFIALLSAFFLSVSPWHLQFSRAAFEGNVGMFFLITALLFLFKGFKKPVFYFLFAGFFILSMYSYHSFRLLNPLILIVVSILFYKDLIKNKFFVIISYLLVVVLTIPIYLNFVAPQGAGARLSMVTIFQDDRLLKLSAEKTLEAKQSNDIFGQIVYNRRVIFIPQMIKGYFDHYNFGFLFLHGDGGLHHHAYNMGMLFLWDFPFIILGLIYLLRKLDRRVILLLLLFILSPLPASVTTGTPQPIRAIAMIPAFQIFVACGVYFLYKQAGRWKRLGLVIISIAGIVFTVNLIYYLYSYFILTPVKYGYFWQYGNKEAILYAKSVENRYNKIIMSYEYDQPYIYYLFYNKIDPAWYQKNWNYSGNGSVDRFFRKIGKYEFKMIEYGKDSLIGKTLIIGSPKEIPVDGQHFIYFPDERLAYKIVGIN